MATPLGLTLVEGQVVIEPYDTSNTTCPPGSTTRFGMGTIRQLPYTSGSFDVDDNVAYLIGKGISFLQFGVNFIIIQESDIYFQNAELSPP